MQIFAVVLYFEQHGAGRAGTLAPSEQKLLFLVSFWCRKQHILLTGQLRQKRVARPIVASFCSVHVQHRQVSQRRVRGRRRQERDMLHRYVNQKGIHMIDEVWQPIRFTIAAAECDLRQGTSAGGCADGYGVCCTCESESNF